MAVTKAGTSKKDTDNGKSTDHGTVIDVDEVLQEGAPVELARVVGICFDRLREIRIQVKRPGQGWTYTGQVIRYPSGPTDEVDGVVRRILDACLGDAHKNGPASAYRARLGLHIDGETNKLDYRYPGVKIRPGPDGELIVVDSSGNTSDSGEDPLVARFSEVVDLAMETATKSLREVTEATERIGKLGGHLARILEVHTDVIEKATASHMSDVELQVRLRELDNEDHVAWADYEIRKQRIETLGRMGDKIAEPAGEAIGKVIELFGDMFGASFFGAAKGPMAEQWQEFMDGLNTEEAAKFREIFTEDEWSVVEAAKDAETDEAFAAQFRKMIELVGAHMSQDEFMAALSKAVGTHMAKLMPIWMKMKEMGL